MSVCTSANNLFSARKVSPHSRRPVADNERWAALNKNIFQDILNAILFQTNFTSGSAAGNKQRHFRPEVGHRSAPPPPAPSLTGSDDDHVTPNDDRKEDAGKLVLLQSFESALDQENSNPDRSWIRPPRSLSTADGKTDMKSSTSRNSDGMEASKMTSRRKDTPVSDSLCPYRRPVGRQGGQSVAFQGYCGLTRACDEASPFGVYCEALLANVPIMIIGLRPYGTTGKGEEGNLVETGNQRSLSLESPGRRESPSQSPENSTKERSPQDFDRPTKILNSKFDHTPLTTQLQPVPPNNYSDDKQQQQQQQQQQLEALSSSPYHHRLHHHHHHSEMSSSSLTSKSSENQPDDKKTGKGEGGEGGGGSKSSRDHSILTILGLLATDGDYDREEETRRRRRKAAPAESSRPESIGERKRLVGIGVTVTGASRWMAVDKDIVYDMIDQVLNAERDFLAAAEPLEAVTVGPGPPSGHLRPGDGNRPTGNRPAVLPVPGTGATATTRRKGVGLLSGHRTQRNKETKGSGGGGGDLTPKHHDKWSRGPMLRWKPNAHQQQLPVKNPDASYHPTRSTAPPETGKPAGVARGTRHSSPDGLEGMSVLRSLLNDDPEDDVISGDGSARDPTPEVAPLPSGDDERPRNENEASDRLPPVKRSRQPFAEGRKKRRTNATTFEPSSSSADLGGSCPLTSGASPDRSALSIKWKSSMLLRMRTAEAANENEALQ